MNERVHFELKGRNPDVLTSIANLSNDEVFTPPDFAVQMLDDLAYSWAKRNNGENIWANTGIKFLDPFTKSGVFLREIAKRLIDAQASQIPDLQLRVNHVLKTQIYGIAITQLTSLISRRSVYCSKTANGEHSICSSFDDPAGNIWFEKMDHSWSSGKCDHCGANQRDYDRSSSESYAYPFLHSKNPTLLISKAFGAEVKFDVVIGNPPYQLGQSGGESVGGFAMPIYQKFIDAAKSLEPRFITMVTPSRWFAGGRGLDEFRSEMLQDHRLTQLVDYPNSAEVFPGVDIKGGVSYFVWDSTANGPCEVTTVVSGEKGAPSTRYLNEYDVLIRRNEALPILKKILEAETNGLYKGRLSQDVSPIQPFSIRTSYRGKTSDTGMKNPVLLYQNGGTGYIERAEIPRNESWVDKWKVLLAGASGSGNDPQVLGKPIVAAPGSACTETYLVIGIFESQQEAENLGNYLRCKLPRFLVSLRKYTQHIYSERFLFVPRLPMDQSWTDADLYRLFQLSDGEQAFVESSISEMAVPVE